MMGYFPCSSFKAARGSESKLRDRLTPSNKMVRAYEVGEIGWRLNDSYFSWPLFLALKNGGYTWVQTLELIDFWAPF